MKQFERIALLVLACALSTFAQSGTGKIKTHVSPSRAGVFIDGKYVGPAGNFGFARTYNVAAGSHEIRLTDPRYQDKTQMVMVTAGQTTDVRDTLTPLPKPQGPFGTIRTIHADKFAAVYVNEKYCGHVDEFSNFAQGLQVPAGEYEVRIVPVNGQEHTEKVTVRAGDTSIVRTQ